MADRQPSRKRRRSLTFVLGFLCVVPLGGALTACGESDEAREEPAALDRARLGEIKRLSSKQYEAIKRVYVATAELDRNDNSGLDFSIVVEDLLAACEPPGDGDPLLSFVLASCAEFVKFQNAVAEVDPCVGTEVCADMYDAARARVQAYGLSLRLNDEAVRATRLPRACKRVFLSKKVDYKEARRYDRAIATLQSATRTASTADDAVAAKRFLRVDSTIDSSSSSGSGDLKRIRRNCRRRA